MAKEIVDDVLRRRAEKLIREGRLPSLARLSQAILEARKKYAIRIRRARHEAAIDQRE
ncbi:MAG TPA: hypothetical protein VJX70_08420 [Candidatus Acidoferrum sp.]|nr:hypothetical protein [Candidatus Acidoferrum sp.]